MAYTKILTVAALTLTLVTLSTSFTYNRHPRYYGYQQGVLAPGQNTPEVEYARINHFKAVDQVLARNYVAQFTPLANNPYAADSLAGLTPDVAQARISHFNDVARANARNSLGAAASLVVDPNENTPEVTYARVAHLNALANARSRNNGYNY